MKTTSRFINAFLIAATTTMLFTSCQEPQPANDTPGIDTLHKGQPADTNAAETPADTTATPADTMSRTSNSNINENRE